MKEIVIIGSGELARELAWLIEDINRYEPTYEFVATLPADAEPSAFAEFAQDGAVHAVLAIEGAAERKAFVDAHPEIRAWENIVHPAAHIAPSCALGKGNVVFPQAFVSPESRIGDFCLIRPQVTIGAACAIGSYATIMPGACVGEHAEINDLSCLEPGTIVKPYARWGFLKNIVLIGAGGFGREGALIIEGVNRYNEPTYKLLGFLDDGEGFDENTTIMGYPWLGTHEWAVEHKDEAVFVCMVADVQIRARLQNELMAQGVVFESLIADSAYVSRTASVGPGCVLYAGVMVSGDSKIGNGVLLNGDITIGHDVVIGDYVTVSPNVGISGNVTIGDGATIGGHSYVIPGRKIGEGAVVGAGSIVVSNVKPHTHVFGNPAKRIGF